MPALAFLFLFNGSVSDAFSNEIRFFQASKRYEYRIKLLELSLEKTRPVYGDFNLKPYEGSAELTQARGIYELEKGKFDVAFLPVSKERIERLMPVRKDIMKGILGLRLFLIRGASAKAFSLINDLDGLRNDFNAGFCDQWADIETLRANRIMVVTSSVYENLFPMLKYGRFDYFPRGINEIGAEFETIKDKYPEIEIEKRLALYYPMPVYFFVNKNNMILAERIEKGLNAAEKDGSFKKLFLEHHGHLLEKYGIAGRIVIRMTNPDIGDEQEPDTSWWIQPDKGFFP